MEFEAVIGLEVHAQLKTQTKIFCGCSTRFGASPNTHTCPVCLGMPGVLPVLNRRVVEFTIKAAIATECEIQKESRFARKNYFYPDLPKGYQISQYELPIARNGKITVQAGETERTIGITRIHMEEDAGKLVHDPHRPVSRVDLNRTGVPLIEIVSEPDIRSSEEAGAYLRELRSILRYIDVSDGNMEEGSFRCDANVSVMPRGSSVYGTRTEIKNLNSFKNVENALEFEIHRQRETIIDGKKVIQETRLWDPDKGITTSMRGKEEAHDYRYFPDPDLLPLVVDEKWIDNVRKELPELPREKRKRYMDEYGLSPYDAGVLTATREMAEYFESCLSFSRNPKQAGNWVMGPLLGYLNAHGKSIEDSPVSAKHLGELVNLIEKGTISGKIAKSVFEEMAETGKNPSDIVDEKGLVQVSDEDTIEPVIDRILSNHPDEVEAYREGKKKLMGFFVGQVMKETKGVANPKTVNQILSKKLES